MKFLFKLVLILTLCFAMTGCKSKVDNPSEAYVIQRLKTIENVSDVSAVTEDNDPNKKLNKPGGYTATVYFTSDWVDQSNLRYAGDTVIDKGTRGGGAVEVYANVKDAEKRNKYLEALDGSILDSGSHSVVGTCVVRTSCELTASQQKELETSVIEALTRP